MRLSNYATYGMMILRGLKGSKKPMTQFELGDLIGQKPGYAQQVVIRLREAGLVAFVQGPHRGYALVNRRKRVSVWDVVCIMPGGVTKKTDTLRGEAAKIASSVDSMIEAKLRSVCVYDL